MYITNFGSYLSYTDTVLVLFSQEKKGESEEKMETNEKDKKEEKMETEIEAKKAELKKDEKAQETKTEKVST